jgi:hypothetical protein
MMKLKNLLSLLFILTAFMIVSPSHLRAQDAPPASQNRQSVIEDLEVVETESGIYYTVKKGDTLWDISRRFSNSPYLWPDLWSGNTQIAMASAYACFAARMLNGIRNRLRKKHR